MSVVDDAKSILETGKVCNFCLGRCFADISSSIDISERGKALRILCAMEADEPYIPIDPEDCWVCKGAVKINHGRWAKRIANELEEVEFGTFQIGTQPPEYVEKNERQLRNEAGLSGDKGWTFNAVVNKEVEERLTSMIEAEVDVEKPDVVAVLDIDQDNIRIQINPVYFYGRYRKLETGIFPRVRECSACNGSGKIEVNRDSEKCKKCSGSGRAPSVEELIAWRVQDIMDASDIVFHTAGGEDSNVLVLGTGRPFVLEVKEPHTRISDVDDLEDIINKEGQGQIEVDCLTFTSSDMVSHVAQQPFSQRYRLTFLLDDPVTKSTLLDIEDKIDGITIRRHLCIGDLEENRRPHEVVRKLKDVEMVYIDNKKGSIEFEIESGIDVESIVSGKDGRTEPNLKSLLNTNIKITEFAIVSVQFKENSE